MEERMIIQRGFKYRLSPTAEQERKFLQCGGNTRFLWNFFLKQNIDYYKETGKFKFFYELAMTLPQLRKDYLFLKESHAQSLQTVARQFDKASKDSFKTKKGFPSFKKKATFNDSFTCPQTWRLGKGFVRIPKIGEVRWIKDRSLRGKPKSITISQEGNQWYCSVLCEHEVKEQEMKADNIAGCDVGLKTFATLSDGTTIANPKHTKKYAEKLTKVQRKLSKKKKGSNNRYKTRLKVRKVHTKIKNTRKDFLHKASNSIVKNYDGIVLEDLNVKGMVKNHCLAKAITDASWSEFKRQLEYKCRWNFKHFIQIGRFEPTSKTCSNCGSIQDMPLNKRQFDCIICKTSIDRDLNAAININRLGRSQINACGDEYALVKEAGKRMLSKLSRSQGHSVRGTS